MPPRIWPAPLQPLDVQLIQPAATGSQPAVASEGSGYLVVFVDASSPPQVRGIAVDGNGRRLGDVTVAATPQCGNPAVAFCGDASYVAWMGFHPNASEPGVSSPGVFGARVVPDHGGWAVAPQGPVLLDPSGVGPPAGVHSYQPSVGSGPRGFLVAWPTLQASWATRVDRDGTVRDASPLGIPGSGRGPTSLAAIASLTDGFLVASCWDDGTWGARVEAAIVHQDGTTAPGPDITPVGSALQTAAPAAASGPGSPVDAQRGLLVWCDHGKGLRASRLDATGALLDAKGIDLIAVEADTAVAWNENRGAYLVVWSGGSPAEIRGLLVDAGGAVQFAGGVSIARGTSGKPAIASNGDGWLVVWENGWAVVR